jgi:conjugative transfer region protein TrbK
MTDVRAFQALSLLTTIGVFAVAACTIQLRVDNAPRPPRAEQTTGASSSDLARCRGVTTEESAGYQHCKQVWGENQRRFFCQKVGPAPPDNQK